MRKLSLQIVKQTVLPLAAAAVSYCVMDSSHWSEVRTEAMLVFSVMAGAVLFRLGRGVPSIDVGEIDVEDVKRLAYIYNTIASRLSWVMASNAIALAGLVLIEFIYKYFTSVAQWATAGLIFSIVFSAIRAIDLVRGDVDLTKFLSSVMIKNAQRRHARKQSASIEKVKRKDEFRPPDNYGKIIDQH